MITKTEVKYIQRLYHKKTREQEQLFIVEGEKMVNELIASDWPIHKLYCVSDFLHANHSNATIITEADLQRISLLTTPNKVLAIVHFPTKSSINTSGIVLALDGIQDPGNLGTIIRTADWFGIKTIICSVDTADCFNPKVVQATMGSISRVAVHYQDLAAFFEAYEHTVYLAKLQGTPLHKIPTEQNGCIVLGNEGKGLREHWPENSKSVGVHIPKMGRAESLNVAIAAGILMAHFCR